MTISYVDKGFDQQLPLEDIHFPKLVSLRTDCLCTYTRMNLPKLENFTIYSAPDQELNLGALTVPVLKSLIVDAINTTVTELPVMLELQELDIGFIDNFDSFEKLAPNLKSLDFCMGENFATTFIPIHMESISYNCSYMDVDVFLRFKKLRKLRLSVPDVVKKEFPGEKLEVEVLDVEDFFDVDGFFDFMDNLRVEKMVFNRSPFDGKMLKSSIALKDVKDLEIKSLYLSDLSEDFRRLFPNLVSIGFSEMYLHSKSSDVSKYTDTLNLFLGLQVQYGLVYGILTDDVWSGLACKGQLRNSFLGEFCSTKPWVADFSIQNFIWNYRPYLDFGRWDYELM